MKRKGPIRDEWLEAQGKVVTKAPRDVTEAAHGPDNRFTIQAGRSWQNTGVHVKAGEVLTVRYASGLWSVNPYHGGLYDGAGSTFIAHQDGYVLKGVAEGALCARIGNRGPAFLVGNFARVVADRDGVIQLVANDDVASAYGPGLKDNQGALKVEVN